MEFSELVQRRRMVRRYDPERAVPRETVTALLEFAVQAPSAGFSQGWGFLVLDRRVDLDLYWSLTTDPERQDSWVAGMRTAPVLLLALSDPEAYARRYTAPDKLRSPLSTAVPAGVGAATDHWPVPWWDVDTGMAALLVLLGATDRGLGGCLAGVPAAQWDEVREAFGIPERMRPVGIITLGHPAPGAGGGRGRTRRPVPDIVRWGRWQA